MKIEISIAIVIFFRYNIYRGFIIAIIFSMKVVVFALFFLFNLFNVCNASISSEEDFRYALIKLSAQVGLSDILYKNSSILYNKASKDWYRTEKHMKNIMEEIPHMIADCALKRGVFANIKDGIVRFANNNVSSYTNANKNAYLIYNYIYSQMYGDHCSVDDIGNTLSENGKYNFNKAVSDVKHYIEDLNLKDLSNYKEINKIPYIEIDKQYNNGEAKFKANIY